MERNSDKVPLMADETPSEGAEVSDLPRRNSMEISSRCKSANSMI
jgi:hypothetical protein